MLNREPAGGQVEAGTGNAWQSADLALDLPEATATMGVLHHEMVSGVGSVGGADRLTFGLWSLGSHCLHGCGRGHGAMWMRSVSW